MEPHNEQVHHSFSMNVPHWRQFQPILPFAGSNGVAPGPLSVDCGGGAGKLGAVCEGPNCLCWGIGCGGCSSPHTPHCRKSSGLWRVHCGHAHSLGLVGTCGEEGGGVGGSCLLRRACSSWVTRRDCGRFLCDEAARGVSVTTWETGCPCAGLDVARVGSGR